MILISILILIDKMLICGSIIGTWTNRIYVDEGDVAMLKYNLIIYVHMWIK